MRGYGEPMRYRRLGKTNLQVSEIGFGAEWLTEMTDDEARGLFARAQSLGVNIVDCWMADPAVRSRLGYVLEGVRDQWIIQGHVGSTWQNGQYERSRALDIVRKSFDDQLTRLRTSYVDLGMIHYVDDPEEFREIMAGEFFEYVQELLDSGRILHVGLSTHNPDVVKLAALDGRIEAVMFSVNPAYDLMPPTDDVEVFFGDYDESLKGMDPTRAEAYALCENNDIGITVMKGYAGGRLLDAAKSPFGVALTPLQCLHYALTRPAVSSVLAGFSKSEHIDEACSYELANGELLGYANVLAQAPKHTYSGQCTYCGHCAPCSEGINIALANKFLDLAEIQVDSQKDVPKSVRQHYLALEPATASACTACRACEPNCPFGVPIADRMAAALELFGA